MDTMQQPTMVPMMRRRFHWIRMIIFWAVVLVILLLWWFGPQVWVNTQTQGYQAVFLTNGQVYFGKVSAKGSWIKLTDIYYLQVTQQLQQASGGNENSTSSTSSANQNQQPNIQLIKLGSELHGPTDVMYIEKDKVLFWENMKDDSKVVQAIQQYNKK